MVCKEVAIPCAVLVPIFSYGAILFTLTYLHHKYKREEKYLEEEHKRAKRAAEEEAAKRVAVGAVAGGAAGGAASGAASTSGASTGSGGAAGGTGQQLVTKTNPATGQVVTETSAPGSAVTAPAGVKTEVVSAGATK